MYFLVVYYRPRTFLKQPANNALSKVEVNGRAAKGNETVLKRGGQERIGLHEYLVTYEGVVGAANGLSTARSATDTNGSDGGAGD